MNPHLLDDARSSGKPTKEKSPKSSRREARETVLQVLYAYEHTHANVPTIIDDVCDSFSELAMDFIKKLVFHAIEQEKELDTLIKTRTQNWDFERIAIIDRLLLRMAICEFLYFDDIPPKVSINEMIEIAKRYSTDRSSKFINGILDAVLDDLKTAGKIHKSGRGMIDV